MRMKYTRKNDELNALLQCGRPLKVSDFCALFNDRPLSSVYAIIRKLIAEGRIQPIGKGVYRAQSKPSYRVAISARMTEVNSLLISTCPGIRHCLSEVNGNLSVMVYKSDIPLVLHCLQEHYTNVLTKKDYSRFPLPLTGYIIVEHLVTESPLDEVDGMCVPSLEKELVDGITDSGQGLSSFDFQKKMETYPVNINRLVRYASRRGVKADTERYLSSVDKQRVELVTVLQSYMAQTAIVRAWIFGSFARGEERADSDVDILIEIDPRSQVSLLTISRYSLDMKDLVGREVDLVEEGCLKPFARPSADHDKYLIYERTVER